MVRDRRYGLFYHAWVNAADMPPEQVLQREVRRRWPNAFQPAYDSGDHHNQNDAAYLAAGHALAALLADILGA